MIGSSIKPGNGLGAALFASGLSWRLSDYGREMLQPGDFNLDEHLERGNYSVVKHGLHRTVYHIRLDGFNIFWKHCRINGMSSYFRQWIRPPKARLEFDAAQALAARGIATIEPLAWGSQRYRYSGPSHLITRELTGAVPLHAFLLEHSQSGARRKIAVLLGRYLARLHEAGVAHPDLHPGNILVTLNSLVEPRFYLLDIHNIFIGQPLSVRASRSNLAIFNRWFVMRADRTDRTRFWHSYIEARGLSPEVARSMAHDVEARTFLSNLRLWRDRDSRCLGANRNFRHVLSDLIQGHAVKEFDENSVAGILDDPDAPFRDPTTILIKDSVTSTVAEIVVVTPNGPRRMIYKRFPLKKRFADVANLVRSSAAMRSWRMGHALIDRGLPTPRPWVVLHRRGKKGPREGYLLCEKVHDASDICEFLGGMTTQRKWDAVAALARMLNRFHDVGLSHRDLKAANLLVTKENGDDYRFHLVDLVGVRARPFVPQRIRARNLSRLNVSFLRGARFTNTDRLRFLRAYLCWALRGKGNWKEWWRQIELASRKKIARNKHTGRPLA